MFAAALLIAALTATFSVATPVDLESRASEASPTVQVCTGGPGVGCVNIPDISSDCVNFNGGLTFLNKEVTTVVVPPGYVCTFFSQFGCLASQGGADNVVLQGGTTNMFTAQGTAAVTVNFNDLSSSFSCSPAFW